MRARMALAISGISHEIREVKLREKPAAMLAASPKGTVPVLVLPDGAVIDESIDIMRWAFRRSDPEDWLSGDDAALIAANDGGFKHNLDRTKYPERYPADGVDHRAAGLKYLMMLESRLTGQDWLCGDRRSIADAAIMPFVRQFAAIDPVWFGAQPIPVVRRWLAIQIASPLFHDVMVVRPQWQPPAAP